MAASTIPNSGGPGSSVELSAVTIAVRDKVIEKFADQPLDEMNESVKQLLSREEDEQKRLGILAARVYILRQRILRIAEGDPDRVVGSASPKSTDLVTNTAETEAPDSSPSEWTRLRILDDCEVNGVRFPKTVIIDVKADDAEKLISNGKAELVEVDPASSKEDASDITPADGIETAEDDSPADAEASVGMSEDTTSADNEETSDAAGGGDTQAADSGELDTPTDTSEPAPAPQGEADNATKPQAETDESGESVIEAPSAAEVTAALEALSTGDETNDGAAAGTVNEADAADVEAELAALDDSPASGGDPEEDTAAVAGLGGDDAADVAAELEAAAAAMAGGSSDPAPKEEPNQESGEDSVQEGAADSADKPGGWFEAQQKAEKSTPTADDNAADGDNADEEESPKNADS